MHQPTSFNPKTKTCVGVPYDFGPIRHRVLPGPIMESPDERCDVDSTHDTADSRARGGARVGEAHCLGKSGRLSSSPLGDSGDAFGAIERCQHHERQRCREWMAPPLLRARLGNLEEGRVQTSREGFGFHSLTTPCRIRTGEVAITGRPRSADRGLAGYPGSYRWNPTYHPGNSPDQSVVGFRRKIQVSARFSRQTWSVSSADDVLVRRKAPD